MSHKEVTDTIKRAREAQQTHEQMHDVQLEIPNEEERAETMAPKKVTKVTVELGDPKPKKAVTRFDSDEDGAALSSVYIDKAALAKLGNPDSVKITIEAA